MAILDDVAQKVRGKGQKIKGRMRNDRLKGTVDQIKGSFNETVADTKLNSRTHTRHHNSDRKAI